MKTYAEPIARYEAAPAKEPRFVLQLSWDEDDTDHTYFTSSDDAALPSASPAVDSISNTFLNVSGQTQHINPDIATSTIGAVNVTLMDKRDGGNRALWSEDRSAAVYTQSNVTDVSDTTTAPDGTMTADTLIATITNGSEWQDVDIPDDASTWYTTVFVKEGTSSVTRIQTALLGGTVVSETADIDWTASPPTISGGGTMEQSTEGFWKVRLQVTNNASGNTYARIATYPAGFFAGTGTVHIWGLNFNDTSHNYYKTTNGILLQGDPLVTKKINEKLESGMGLRGKIARVYVGYETLDFADYDLRLTYIIDSITYKDGVYMLAMADIQRQVRKKIFTPDETTLNTSISSTDTLIPVNTSDATKFRLLQHGIEWQVRPNETVGYIKIKDEVICHTGLTFDGVLGWSLVAIERGALNTRPAIHAVDPNATASSQEKVIEHVYIEGAVPKIIYALLTGVLAHGNNKIADPYDFTAWNTTGTPAVTATADATPAGWGAAYSVTDNDAAAYESIHTLTTDGYVHGDTWTVSTFVKKEVAANTSRFDILFQFGAATSACTMQFDASTGVIGTVNTINTVAVASEVFDVDDNWWHIRLSAYSTTTGTTNALFLIYPAVVGVADTGSVTLFLATLCPGNRIGWTILPTEWRLGISSEFSQFSDFAALGKDYWNLDNDTGRFVRIENPGTQDGKKYIETEMLLWLGAFMPIYSNGAIGIRRLAGVLSESAFDAALGRENIKSYSQLTHDMRSVINVIRIHWNWIDSKQQYTKEALLVDQDSIDKHGRADEKVFKFKTVHVGIHTDEDILTYFDILRDRYSGPPLLMSVSALPSMSMLEVGDVPNMELDTVYDYTKDAILNRPFEVQQVSTNWATGALQLKLFGSSQKAGELSRTTLANVLNDTFYTREGTSLDSSDSPPGPLTIVAGAVTANGTITGNVSNNKDATAIYYYDGNLTINAGVTVTIDENVQLRIKGTLQINGTIEGIGNGATGGTGVSTYADGLQYDFWKIGGAQRDGMNQDHGEQGYFGTTIAPDPLNQFNSRVGSERWPVQRTSPGQVSEVPFYQLTNDNQTDALSGFPDDLRGNSGPGGMPYEQGLSWFNDPVKTSDYEIKAAGGNGGDGGAGLVIIARGVAFGGSGKIDLSGGDSAAGVEFDLNNPASRYAQYPGGHYISAGPGGPGAPGALMILMDGDATNPDINDTNFIANYGSTNAAAGVVEITREELNQLSVNKQTYYGVSHDTYPYDHSHLNGGQHGATENISRSAGAHKIIYIPPDETPGLADETLFYSLPDWAYTEINRLQDDTPASGDGYGKSAALTNDGTRILTAQGHLTATERVDILRNATNTTVEQTITSGEVAVAAFGREVGISQAGDRLFITAWGATVGVAGAGKVHIYARTGVTWALEQTLVEAVPVASDGFGDRVDWNADADKILIRVTDRPATTKSLRYYDRAGTAWTRRTPPAHPISNFGTASKLAMANNGEWCIAADNAWQVSGTTTGAAQFYSRNGTAWTHEKTLTPLLVDGTRRYGTNDVALNWDATAIVVGMTDGVGASPNPCWVDVYHRIGDTYNLLQSIERPSNPAGTNAFGFLMDMSDDGLTLVITDYISEEVHIYRRDNIAQRFSDYQLLGAADVGGAAASFAMGISPAGKMIAIGNDSSDITAANAGVLYLWQTQAQQ